MGKVARLKGKGYALTRERGFLLSLAPILSLFLNRYFDSEVFGQVPQKFLADCTPIIGE